MDTPNRHTHPKGPVGKEPCASMPAGLLDAAKGVFCRAWLLKDQVTAIMPQE